MNIQTADKFVKLRKENGLSQEALAEKLGVSRQAISKWERAEASPDIDNLISLAKLYGVTLDELMGLSENTSEQEKTQEESDTDSEDNTANSEQEQDNSGVSFKNGIHVHDGKSHVDISLKDGIKVEDDNGKVNINFKDGIHVEDKNSSKYEYTSDSDIKNHIFTKGKDKSGNILLALLCPSVVITYLLTGFLIDGAWRVNWLMFFLIPIIASAYDAFYKKKLTIFAYPILVVGLYLSIGMFFYIWHPTWVLFLTIPLFYIFADWVKKNK